MLISISQNVLSWRDTILENGSVVQQNFQMCILVPFLEIYKAHVHIKALRSPARKKHLTQRFPIYLITESLFKNNIWSYFREIVLYFERW